MSFHSMKNPTGGVNVERVIQSLAPDKHLLKRILSKENVSQSWKRVKSNKGSPGIDGVTIDSFPEATRSHWSKIRQSINLEWKLSTSSGSSC